jgi:hypothetical protein
LISVPVPHINGFGFKSGSRSDFSKENISSSGFENQTQFPGNLNWNWQLITG